MTIKGQRPHLGDATAAAYVRALLDIGRLVRGDSGLSEVLAAVARVVSETLGFATVVVNLYRPETDDYEVTTVHGNERARAVLLRDVSPAHTWAPMLDSRFLRHGAYFIPEGALDWASDATTYTPTLAGSTVDEPSDWRPEDGLFVSLDGVGGRHYGIISVDEPVSGRRPDDGLLDVLSAVAAHAALAIESARQFAQLEGALVRHRAVLESSLDGVLAVDRRGYILEFNPAAERLFGHRREDVVGQDLADLLIPPQNRANYRRALARVFEDDDLGRHDRRTEMTGLRADGSTLLVELSVTVVQGSQDAGPVAYGFVRDISERRRGEEELTYLAYHDPLTGLPNRVLVEEQLDLALARARRTGRAVALMFVDLDDFKDVNDKLGHAAGDQLLAAVATRLRAVLRDSDLLARQGGDEFIVLLSDLAESPVRAAEAVGVKLLGALREPFVVASTEERTGASIGISLYPDDASDTEALLRHADAAMYDAKAAGGGRVVFHRPADTIVARRASVSAQLRRALADSEFELHYEPAWRLSGQRGIASVEALLRWRNSDRGLLKPDAFISLAEQSEVGDEVVDWLLGEACRNVRLWHHAGLFPRLGVNISAYQLLAPDFAARFMGAVTEHGLAASALTIELTESAWTVDSAETLAVLADLRAAGTGLAIDGFGAGFSSLSRLPELDFDVIKIDRGLLAGVPRNSTATAVLRAVVNLAHACDAQIIAEGVESVEQIDFLSANGIDQAQGFLFGQSVDGQEIVPLLARHLLVDGAPAYARSQLPDGPGGEPAPC
jgi:diguanylate cyclase (GGDEF)-like protein/PAS domain S-box-containing protein